MQIEILSAARRTAKDIDAFLKTKGCPMIAATYQTEGEALGVGWDIAIFQSILETGWFTFDGDVDEAQNNFAGLGATGNGVHGDSFSTVTLGVRAQMQDLALRCGVDISIEDIVSPYVKKNYELIKSRKSKYWADLAGTWAADLKYWDKIQMVIAQFDGWIAEQLNVPSTVQDIYWFELNRTDDGRPAVTAYNSVNWPRYTRFFKNKAHLIEFLQAFPLANTIVVAPTETKVIPACPDFGVAPIPPKKRLTGKPFLCEPGHSRSQPGAHGLGSATIRPEEYEHNVIAANTIAQLLQTEGAVVDTFDPNPDNLSAVGQRAEGKVCAIFNHHNAYDADGEDEGTGIYVHPEASANCRLLAEEICAAICKAIGSKNRGVEEARFTVLTKSIATDCRYNMLIEYYFIDDYSNRTVTEARTRAAAEATAQVLVQWFGE